MQLQTSLINARRQLDELRQAGQQQEQQAAEVSQQLAALRADRAAAVEETHSAQQELQRVLRELEQCQQVGGVQEKYMRAACRRVPTKGIGCNISCPIGKHAPAQHLHIMQAACYTVLAVQCIYV